MPRLETVDGHTRLFVDDQPFLILGLQWDCECCFTPQAMNPLFPHAKRMGANTAALPVYWREIEPEPGIFDFHMMEERLAQADLHDMRLVLLWFATWKNASAFYAPDFIRDNPVTYPPAVDAHGQALVSLCASAETTWQRDRDALIKLMLWIKEHDKTNRVILVQVENEPGVLGSGRCHCDVCNAALAAEDWTDHYGADADEAFAAASIAKYIERLAVEAKQVHPLPLYMNVWLSPDVAGRPGVDYPSGGATPQMIGIHQGIYSAIDFIAPDIYRGGFRDFHHLCQVYQAGGQPLYVAEHSTDPTGRAERNVYYAIGEYGAIGFDPWSIDSPHPNRYAPPLVDVVGGEWGPQAYWLRDSYVAIGRAVSRIVAAQDSGRMYTIVQEPAELGTGWAAEGCDLIVEYRDRENAGRGLVIQEGPDEFLLVGSGYTVAFRQPGPDGRPRQVRKAELGEYQGDTWVVHHPVRRERPESTGYPILVLEPSVVRVWLEPA
jgi:hypothetical protein